MEVEQPEVLPMCPIEMPESNVSSPSNHGFQIGNVLTEAYDTATSIVKDHGLAVAGAIVVGAGAIALSRGRVLEDIIGRALVGSGEAEGLSASRTLAENSLSKAGGALPNVSIDATSSEAGALARRGLPDISGDADPASGISHDSRVTSRYTGAAGPDYAAMIAREHPDPLILGKAERALPDISGHANPASGVMGDRLIETGTTGAAAPQGAATLARLQQEGVLVGEKLDFRKLAEFSSRLFRSRELPSGDNAFQLDGASGRSGIDGVMRQIAKRFGLDETRFERPDHLAWPGGFKPDVPPSVPEVIGMNS
jgi:hypothetical protein